MIDVKMEAKDRVENTFTSLARSCLFLLVGFSIAMVVLLRILEGLKAWCAYAYVCYTLSRVKQF